MSVTPYYVDGGVTIYHGDCREILPSIDPSTVDLVLTDPPYGISVDTMNASRGARPSKPNRAIDHPPVFGDDEPFDPSHLLRFGRCVLWGANNYASRLPDASGWFVWDRRSGDSRTADAELAWTNLAGTVRTFRHTWNGLCRDSEIGFHVHPTQKPVSLMRWVVERSTKPGDLVLDPYMGSGPVARAAKDSGRRYVGIEISEAYCEIAAKRLAQEVLDFGGVA